MLNLTSYSTCYNSIYIIYVLPIFDEFQRLNYESNLALNLNPVPIVNMLIIIRKFITFYWIVSPNGSKNKVKKYRTEHSTLRNSMSSFSNKSQLLFCCLIYKYLRCFFTVSVLEWGGVMLCLWADRWGRCNSQYV